jgi:hypothetical protein
VLSSRDFRQILDEVFDHYLSTLRLLDNWLLERKNMQEFVILVCARLDSLTNLAFGEEKQANNFASFVTKYSKSGQDLEKVSLPDLYRFLKYHECVLPGTISKPGRLHMFDPRRDKDLINLIWRSGVAITEREVGMLLRFFLRHLKQHYRVVPNQSLNKSSHDTAKSIRNRLQKAADSYKNEYYSNAVSSIGPILNKYKLAALLYRDYRCGAIHGYRVYLDEQDFFTRREPYWSTIWSEMMEPSRFLTLHFPGAFLLRLLEECVRKFKDRLTSRKILPADLFFEFSDFHDDLHYLDEESIPSGKDLSLNV